MKLYRRFSEYIGATPFISAISQIYQRNSIYIGDFPNISAQLHLYQRFFQYIDLSTIIATYKIKKVSPKYILDSLFLYYTRTCNFIFGL
ncbi:hypothetical protein B9T53_21065 [Bacillus sp. KbaL1]|nr:hypothetical protein [Bacillus cereus]OXL93768.1 hypothetical protein B9T53_21065 [Bacillus sp. KbaL1]